MKKQKTRNARTRKVEQDASNDERDGGVVRGEDRARDWAVGGGDGLDKSSARVGHTRDWLEAPLSLPSWNPPPPLFPQGII